MSLFARNKAMLCKVLVSLDLSNMYVSLTTLRTFSEKENGERESVWVMFVVFVTVKIRRVICNRKIE